MDRDEDDFRTFAGILLFASGTVAVLGIVTAETQYPGYSTAHHTISRLGVTAPGDVVPAAAAIFNGAMILGGLLVLGAAYCLHQTYDDRHLTGVVGLAGLGEVGVGLFPANYALPHTIAALLAFGAGGLAAVVAAKYVRPPFRYASVLLGVVALVALVLFAVVEGANPLGLGGIERWIAYPILLWATGVGGYLLGEANGST